MNERSADPARTHALVVGIEKYDAGSDWNLDGPASDALEFYRWLLAQGVPAKHIHTLLCPLDDNAALVAEADAEPATSTKIRKDFNELHEQKGDLLFLFWAGHGIVSAEQERRLFYADATGDDKRNLDLDSLLKSLGSSYLAGFPRQIIIVDACANYEEEMQWAFKLPSDALPIGDPLAGHEQFVFLAARSGQVAKNLGDERRGLFSREVLHEISQAHAEDWPPDMVRVAEVVQARIAALRKAGEASQAPVYLWNRDWDGTTIKLGTPPMPENDPYEPVEPWTLGFEQIVGLTDGLLACQVMQSPSNRQAVLRLLPSEIADSVTRGDSAQADVLGIVETASNYPEGIEKLLQVVHFFERGSISWRRLEKVARAIMPGFQSPSEGVAGVR